MTSRSIYNLVRALTNPYVGAHVLYKEKEYKVWKSKEVSSKTVNFEPGRVVAVKNNIITVKTGDDAVELVEHDFKILPRVKEYLL